MNIMKNDRGFAYLDFVSGSHGHMRTRVWVHNSLVIDEQVGFPAQGQIQKTEKGGLVLRPASGYVYFVEIPSGYRGSASIESVTGGTVVADGLEFASGQGALGATAWALVNAEGPISVVGQRTGRRVDQTCVTFTLYPDGRQQDEVEAEVEGLLTDA